MTSSQSGLRLTGHGFVLVAALVSIVGHTAAAAPASPSTVPLYRVFELQLKNANTSAPNKFRDVWLNTTFTSPSARSTPFWGFFSGGDIWRLRFMPNETGRWTFRYSFSDNSMAGGGAFVCVEDGASPGVIQVYEENPHWFAYNSKTPVFIKSYYVKAGGVTRQPIDWVRENLYQKMVDHGYNHHMSSGVLPVLPLTAEWDGQPLLDGPPAINRTIYMDPASPSTSMQLDVWESLEQHLGFLNDHDIAVDFFQGFSAQGPDSGRLQFGALNATEKRWWVSYILARLAPFANMAGFVYSWETGGRGDDLHLATLLKEMDPFGHLVTYEDANAIASNWYNLSEWDFASVETYGGIESHHNMSLAAYRGKPVYFTEAHLLWRSFWFAAESVIPSTAWAVTTAAASFTWNDMGDHRITGPYRGSQAFNTYPTAVKAIDILANVMVNETTGFYKLVPADHLLRGSRPPLTFCMAEQGAQYLVYSDSGQGFELDTSFGSNSDIAQYTVTWFDAVDDQHVVKMPQKVTGGSLLKFQPPSTTTHWVGLLLKA